MQQELLAAAIGLGYSIRIAVIGLLIDIDN